VRTVAIVAQCGSYGWRTLALASPSPASTVRPPDSMGVRAGLTNCRENVPAAPQWCTVRSVLERTAVSVAELETPNQLK